MQVYKCISVIMYVCILVYHSVLYFQWMCWDDIDEARSWVLFYQPPLTGKFLLPPGAYLGGGGIANYPA